MCELTKNIEHLKSSYVFEVSLDKQSFVAVSTNHKEIKLPYSCLKGAIEIAKNVGVCKPLVLYY